MYSQINTKGSGEVDCLQATYQQHSHLFCNFMVERQQIDKSSGKFKSLHTGQNMCKRQIHKLDCHVMLMVKCQGVVEMLRSCRQLMVASPLLLLYWPKLPIFINNTARRWAHTNLDFWVKTVAINVYWSLGQQPVQWITFTFTLQLICTTFSRTAYANAHEREFIRTLALASGPHKCFECKNKKKYVQASTEKRLSPSIRDVNVAVLAFCQQKARASGNPAGVSADLRAATEIRMSKSRAHHLTNEN